MNRFGTRLMGAATTPSPTSKARGDENLDKIDMSLGERGAGASGRASEEPWAGAAEVRVRLGLVFRAGGGARSYPLPPPARPPRPAPRRPSPALGGFGRRRPQTPARCTRPDWSEPRLGGLRRATLAWPGPWGGSRGLMTQGRRTLTVTVAKMSVPRQGRGRGPLLDYHLEGGPGVQVLATTAAATLLLP